MCTINARAAVMSCNIYNALIVCDKGLFQDLAIPYQINLSYSLVVQICTVSTIRKTFQTSHERHICRLMEQVLVNSIISINNSASVIIKTFKQYVQTDLFPIKKITKMFLNQFNDIRVKVSFSFNKVSYINFDKEQICCALLD